MPETHYRQALEAACREWEQLAARRDEVDSRLADLQRTIASLTALCGLEPTVALGLTDGCRMVLRCHREQALSARRVMEELEALGLDLSGHASPLASIHVTLKRLVEAGEARFIPRSKGTPPMYALEERPAPARHSLAHAPFSWAVSAFPGTAPPGGRRKTRKG